MEQYTLTWTSEIGAILVLVLLYGTLLLALNLLRVYNRSQIGRRAQRLIEYILALYEPLCIIILMAIFILINPVLHGLIVLFLVVLLFQPIRNYLSGRVLLLSDDLHIGQHINVMGSEGIVQRQNRLGFYLKTNEGNRYINYSKLLSEGFTTLKGKQVGGFHLLGFSMLENEFSTEKQLAYLHRKLLDCPYLDWSYRPMIQRLSETDYQLSILVNEERHLRYFIQLLEEWGYSCRLIQ